MIRLLLSLALVTLMIGCSRTASTGASGLITDRGIFPSPSGASQLVIGSKSNSLVDYKIINAVTKKDFFPDNLFSDAMRWAAFWQDDDTLWVHSSDIGLSVWKRDPQGDFTQEWLGTRSELIPSIPTEIWDFLPSSTKRQWEPLRKQASGGNGGQAR